MKIALAQLDVKAGNPRKNLERMLEMIEEAKDNKADLIAFPEMSVGGYLVGDKWTEEAFANNLQVYNQALQEASKGIAVAYGNIFTDREINERTGSASMHPNKDGRLRKYNAVYVFQDGKPAKRANETTILPTGVQPKTLLPNYRIFDDERYFYSLKDQAQDFGKDLEELVQPFILQLAGKEVPVGFEVCEDLWSEDYRKDGEMINPTRYLIDNGAELVVNISASPWTYGKNAARDRRVQRIAKDQEENGKQPFVPFLYTNAVGAQNNGKNIVTFDGGATAYNAQGLPVTMDTNMYREGIMYVDDAILQGAPKERPEQSRIAQKYRTIIRGVQHLKDILGKEQRFVIGLSGGIDSAVSLCLLEQALGKDAVEAVNLPTNYNSDQTKNAAKKLADNLGVNYNVVPIQPIVDLVTKTLIDADIDGTARKPSSLNEENIQAKIRGTDILSNIAGIYGLLMVNNGNKMETAQGYATLYGDVNGAIAPLGDLLKAEVYDLAQYLNEEVYGKEVIPNELLPDDNYEFGAGKIVPSAELKEAQKDPFIIHYHSKMLEQFTDYKKKSMEDITTWYQAGTLEQQLGIKEGTLEKYGLHEPEAFLADLEWFSRNINNTVFKRIQAPPIIMTSKSSYGYDIRESMLPSQPTEKYLWLKEQIMGDKEQIKKQYEVSA